MIRIESSGLQTSIQDSGRLFYRKFGVPCSGVMDAFSARMANSLLGNAADEAVMEFAYTGPTLFFQESVTIAISGADFKVRCGEAPVPLNKPFLVSKNSVLKIGSAGQGVYGYLAIKGGFKTPKVLGSRSFYKEITEKSKLERGDKLEFNSSIQQISTTASIKFQPTISTQRISVFPGPEFENLDKKTQEKLFNENFTINSQSNRMAVLLDSEIPFSAGEIITSPVLPGTVQLTPSGKMIVLMRDAQTTGGYARILQLSEKAINHLAQKRAGEVIRFELLRENQLPV